MAFKYLAGCYMNAFGRGQNYGSAGESNIGISGGGTGWDSIYPVANAYDGIPALPAKLQAVTSGTVITFSNNLVQNGDFEQGTVGWTAYNATLTSEAGTYALGAKSLKIVTTSTYGQASQDITVQAGEYLQVWGAIKSDGTNLAYLNLYCLETAQVLKSDGTWAAPGYYPYGSTTNTWKSWPGNGGSAVAFQVPTCAQTGRTTLTLRIQLIGAANAQTCYFDEVLLVPGIDFLGIFGHNLEPHCTVKMEKDNAGDYWHSGWGTGVEVMASAAVTRQSWRNTGTMFYDPFPGIVLWPGGTWGSIYTTSPPMFGEIVVGQMRTLPRSPKVYGRKPRYLGQQRDSTPGGTTWVYNALSYPTEEIRMILQTPTIAAIETWTNEMLLMTEGGRYPLILVPEGLDSAAAIYGRVEDVLSFDITDPAGYSLLEVTVKGEPLPRL